MLCFVLAELEALLSGTFLLPVEHLTVDGLACALLLAGLLGAGLGWGEVVDTILLTGAVLLTALWLAEDFTGDGCMGLAGGLIIAGGTDGDIFTDDLTGLLLLLLGLLDDVAAAAADGLGMTLVLLLENCSVARSGS